MRWCRRRSQVSCYWIWLRAAGSLCWSRLRNCCRLSCGGSWGRSSDQWRGLCPPRTGMQTHLSWLLHCRRNCSSLHRLPLPAGPVSGRRNCHQRSCRRWSRIHSPHRHPAPSRLWLRGDHRCRQIPLMSRYCVACLPLSLPPLLWFRSGSIWPHLQGRHREGNTGQSRRSLLPLLRQSLSDHRWHHHPLRRGPLRWSTPARSWWCHLSHHHHCWWACLPLLRCLHHWARQVLGLLWRDLWASSLSCWC